MPKINDLLKNAVYKNPHLSIDERVTDLLSFMTIDEKIAQLTGVWNGGIDDFDDAFFNNPEKMKETFANGVNSVHPAFWGLKKTIEQRNKIQKYLLEETRLGIPAIFVDEGQHGLMRPDATVFPQAIGLACSWDPELFEDVYSVVALEMRSRGTQLALSPVIDVCRDPRWGRVEETYGEDPYLNGIYGIAAVKGLQGTNNGKVAPGHVGATLKHFVGHGEPEGGQNQGPANYSLRVLRDYHMPPFKTTIKGANPVAVMPSYNEVDGVPSHSSKWLIKDVLRKEWGYKNFIVADYFAIDQLFIKDCVVSNEKEAALTAFNAGVQYEFPKANLYKYLPELINEGRVKIEDVDNAVKQVLEYKFRLGLFENPYVDFDTAHKVSKNPESKKLAFIAASKSIVLLKNENLLPLHRDKYKKIAVIGPCSKDVFFGGYAGKPYNKVSIYEGIKQKAGNNTEVLFAQGCKLTENITDSFFNWKNDEIVFASHEDNMKLIVEAVEIAKKAEVVILAIGENEHLCREAYAKSHLGDTTTLNLICDQEDLVKAIVALNKPVVVYLMNGRPLSVNYIADNVPAIIEGWYMGQETGHAVADIIFGDINPSGKLTITIPKSAGQLPMYYNHKPGAQFHNYISQDIKPLYSFGYGLSYTQFKFGEPKLEKYRISKNESVKVEIEVTNMGKVAGDEIVQLYIRDKVSSVTRPVKELKGFKRITLKSAETKTVSLEIVPEHLSFYDINMDYLTEPGEFEIMVGNSSRDEDLQKIILVVTK